MRRAAILVALAACRFPDDPVTIYQCEPDGACPAGHACVDQLCVPERSRCASAVSAGDRHSCALRGDGTAWCWGSNRFGQLGDGTTDDRTTPVPVATGARFTAIAAGTDHTCAVADDRTVWCWGSNVSGQRGGTVDSLEPAQIADLGGVTAITVGEAHSCALLDNGSVRCWGINGLGQLGNGSRLPSRTPVPVTGLVDIQKIAAGGGTTCALDRNAALSCWGENSVGQLGDHTLMLHATPFPFPSTGPIADFGVGRQLICTLTSSGAVDCTGLLHGRPSISSATPIRIRIPVPVGAVTVGAHFACATEAADGPDPDRVWCWGENSSLQLADDLPLDHLTPLVSRHAGVTALAGGGAHLCALSQGGSLQCSGDNGFGQLGDGHRTTQSRPPPPIPSLVEVTSITAGDAHTCAVAGGEVLCWGRNNAGQLGDGSIDDRSVPTRVVGVPEARQVVVGNNHSCALLADDTVMCWGENLRGQLGDGTVVDRALARLVVDGNGAVLQNVVLLAAGGDHSCARIFGGTVACWGANGFGESGSPEDRDMLSAVLVPGVSDAFEIATGFNHSCASKFNGLNPMNRSVVCWGRNGDGELGNGGGPNSRTPVDVAGLVGVEHLSSHGSFTCAVASGQVTCWGRGVDGQIGDGSVSNRPSPGASVSGVSGVVRLMAGGAHACAVSSAGVQCWGSSSAGQVGAGEYVRTPQPVVISFGDGDFVRDLAGGTNHSCARINDNRVTCWGENRDGQLGDGSFDTRAPVAPLLECP